MCEQNGVAHASLTENRPQVGAGVVVLTQIVVCHVHPQEHSQVHMAVVVVVLLSFKR